MDSVRPRSRMPANAVRERDAALRRMGRARGVAIAASAGLSAAFAGLVASSPPGQASAAPRVHYTPAAPRHGANTSAARVSAPSLPPLASASALGLQAPAQTPDAASTSNSSGSSSSSSAAQTAPSASSQASSAPSASSGSAAAAPSAPAASASQPAPAPTPQPAPVVSGGS